MHVVSLPTSTYYWMFNYYVVIVIFKIDWLMWSIKYPWRSSDHHKATNVTKGCGGRAKLSWIAVTLDFLSHRDACLPKKLGWSIFLKLASSIYQIYWKYLKERWLLASLVLLQMELAKNPSARELSLGLQVAQDSNDTMMALVQCLAVSYESTSILILNIVPPWVFSRN